MGVGKAMKAFLAVLVLAGAAAGISYATSAITRTATSTLQACANNTNGNLRLVAGASDCRTNETAVSWNVIGPAGKDGVDGKNGIDGKDGANGVSPVVAQLAANDPNCPTGGASITDAAGHVAYVCNGAKGDTGASGTPFSGLFQSPSGDFKLSVTDAGIKLQGPLSKITLDGSSLTVESSTSLTVRAGANLSLDSSGAATLKGGGLVTIGGSSCTPPVRVSDIVGAFVGVNGSGTFPVTFPSLVPAADVCIG